jgi:hypothetical protein
MINIKNISMKTYKSILLMGVLLFSSCNSEYLNPSTASETQVVNDVAGLINLANGLSYKFSVGGASPEYTVATASGLSAGELNVLNAGNLNEQLLLQGGGSVLGDNGVLTNIWNQSNLIKANANIILKNLTIVTDQGTKGGLQAHASIFKAMALGNLAMFWEKAPVEVMKNAPFVTRAEVLNQAIAILEAAATELAKAPISTYFISQIAGGIDYANTINALIARYALMVGNYDKALTAANSVSLAVAVKSVLNHDNASQNALFLTSFNARNVTEPFNAKFSLPAVIPAVDPADKRIAFFFNTTAATPPNNLAKSSFYSANGTAVPIYRPGEITLIKAEANVRKASPDLTAAVTEINKILTKDPATDAYGIGTGLAATYGGANTASAILDEVYKQRCIELFLTGLRLEDSRRFNRPGPGVTGAERTRNFMPYPFSERDNNTNTPADPAN